MCRLIRSGVAPKVLHAKQVQGDADAAGPYVSSHPVTETYSLSQRELKVGPCLKS